MLIEERATTTNPSTWVTQELVSHNTLIRRYPQKRVQRQSFFRKLQNFSLFFFEKYKSFLIFEQNCFPYLFILYLIVPSGYCKNGRYALLKKNLEKLSQKNIIWRKISRKISAKDDDCFQHRQQTDSEAPCISESKVVIQEFCECPY